MTGNNSYSSEEVIDALHNLFGRKRKEIAAGIRRRFYWFENCVSAPTIDELIDDAGKRLRTGTRKFYRNAVNLSDDRSLMGAFIGVVRSIGNEHVQRLKDEASQFEEFQDEDDNHRVSNDYAKEIRESGSSGEDMNCVDEVGNAGSPNKDANLVGARENYELPPDGVIELREERSRLARIGPRSEANVREFLEFLERKDERLHYVCKMRRLGKKNHEIALLLNSDSKTVGNMVTELKRQAIRFFSMPKNDVRQRTRRYRKK